MGQDIQWSQRKLLVILRVLSGGGKCRVSC